MGHETKQGNRYKTRNRIKNADGWIEENKPDLGWKAFLAQLDGPYECKIWDPKVVKTIIPSAFKALHPFKAEMHYEGEEMAWTFREEYHLDPNYLYRVGY